MIALDLRLHNTHVMISGHDLPNNCDLINNKYIFRIRLHVNIPGKNP